jgi:cysteine desulfurase/selenocysteine lyase
MEAVRDHERALTSRALEVLGGVEGVSILGPGDPDEASGIVSFLVGDVHTHDVSTILDSLGVAVRGGHHCCQPLMRHLGIAGTVRASFYVYNTEEEVDRLAEGLVRVQEVFGRVA